MICLIRSIPMEGMIGDAVQGPEAEIETGARQSFTVSLNPIGYSLRGDRREPDSIEVRSHTSKGIGDHFTMICDYIFQKI